MSSDLDMIMSRRHDNGGDYWASADGRFYVGNPFSTIGALGMLHELEVNPSHEAIQGGLDLILQGIRDDGRIRVAPKAPLYPCYTAEAARMLCRFELKDRPEVTRTVDYLMANTHEGGGWRCSFSRFGKGPETEFANPGATLYALDVLRFFPQFRQENLLIDQAISFLLGHWDSRAPLGPCHWGIGTLFMQVEYPFLRYNLFYYVYVLSFFSRAKEDGRFREAVRHLKSKTDINDQMVVERPHRQLKGLAFCTRGQPSKFATRRFNEIEKNLLL